MVDDYLKKKDEQAQCRRGHTHHGCVNAELLYFSSEVIDKELAVGNVTSLRMSTIVSSEKVESYCSR